MFPTAIIYLAGESLYGFIQHYEAHNHADDHVESQFGLTLRMVMHWSAKYRPLQRAGGSYSTARAALL